MTRIPRPGRDVHPGEMFEDDPHLAAFARDLRSAADATPPPAVGASLAAVFEGRAVAAAPAWLPPTTRRRRAGMRWVIGGAAFGLGLGSLGVAGALPGPVQRQVARWGDVVGVDLPAPAEDTPVTSVVPTTAPPSTVPPARTSHPTSTTLPVHEDGRGADDGVVGEHPGPGTSVDDPGQGDEHRSGDSQGDRGSSEGEDERDTSTPAADNHGDGDGEHGDGEQGDVGDSVDKQSPDANVGRESNGSHSDTLPTVVVDD